MVCHAAGSPPPSVQWLQQTPAGEVLVRGYEPELRIERASYAHQGSFVCSARNSIGEVQSDPVLVEILGRPEIDTIRVKTEYVLNLGEDLRAVVEYCARPAPRVTWNLGGVGQAGRTVELIAGSTFERFHAGSSGAVGPADQHCFAATLLISDVQLSDAKEFELRVENDYGREMVKIRVVVVDTRLFTEEVFAAIIVGGVLTILLISVVIIYVVRAGCCVGKATKQDAGSDKTDLESCRSSTESSSSRHSSSNTVLPPDALYGTVKKAGYFEPEFNNSKEKLRPDLIYSTGNSPYSGRSYSVKQGVINPLDTAAQGLYTPGESLGLSDPAVLGCSNPAVLGCFNPAVLGCSNPVVPSFSTPVVGPQFSGSYRKKKKHPEYRSQGVPEFRSQGGPEFRNQGVDCQINSSSCQSNSSLDDILYSYSSNIHYRDDI